MASFYSTKQLPMKYPPSKLKKQYGPESEISCFFHYTNEKGANSIARHGYIKASSDPRSDAFFGEGVYLTSLPPYKGKKEVARNNWTAFNHALKSGKLDYVIMIYMPEGDLERAKTKRDVYLYKGNLYLKEYRHKILTWKKAARRWAKERLRALEEDDEDEESDSDDSEDEESDSDDYEDNSDYEDCKKSISFMFPY